MTTEREATWFGVPLSKLTPVKRRECYEFLRGNEAGMRNVELSGPLASMEEYEHAVAEHTRQAVFGGLDP